MAKEYRNWTHERKLRAILPILRGEVDPSEQARRFKMSETMLHKWRNQASQALLEAFVSGDASMKERGLKSL